jgi:methylglutaconyl-CoA hydratase
VRHRDRGAGRDVRAFGGEARHHSGHDLAVRRYFLTGERFTAAEAFRIGLLHDIVPLAELDGRIDEMLGALMIAGPAAQLECKALVRGVAHRPIDADLITGTALHIADVRASPEGKEGVAAFLEKRKPSWMPTGQGDA